MRQTMKEIEVNVAYRWFLGLDMLDPVPHFSTFGKNYTRRFKDTDLFEQIFSKILEKRGWNTARFLLILKKIKEKKFLKKNGAGHNPQHQVCLQSEPVFLNTGFICYMAAAS